MTDAEGFISPDRLLAHAPGNTPKALFSTIVALICKQCDYYIETTLLLHRLLHRTPALENFGLWKICFFVRALLMWGVSLS
jgi:hypothetical protein